MAKRICVSICHRNELFREGIKQILQRANYRVLASSSNFNEGCKVDHTSGDLIFLIEETPELASEFREIPDLKSRYPGCRVVVLFNRLTMQECHEAQKFGVDGALLQSISSDVLLRCLDLVHNGDLPIMLIGGQFAPQTAGKPHSLGAMPGQAQEAGETEPLPDAIFGGSSEDEAVPSAIVPAGDPDEGVDALKLTETPVLNETDALKPTAGPLDADASPLSSAADFVGDARPNTKNEILDQRRRLSVREQDILRCLVEGFSNKVIARRCGITEATVKVHLKAILRKIHVVNRTQAAVWAITNINNKIGNKSSVAEARPPENIPSITPAH